MRLEAFDELRSVGFFEAAARTLRTAAQTYLPYAWNGWKARGEAIEKGADSVSEPVTARYEIDQAASVAEWMGDDVPC